MKVFLSIIWPIYSWREIKMKRRKDQRGQDLQVATGRLVRAKRKRSKKYWMSQWLYP